MSEKSAVSLERSVVLALLSGSFRVHCILQRMENYPARFNVLILYAEDICVTFRTSLTYLKGQILRKECFCANKFPIFKI